MIGYWFDKFLGKLRSPPRMYTQEFVDWMRTHWFKVGYDCGYIMGVADGQKKNDEGTPILRDGE